MTGLFVMLIFKDALDWKYVAQFKAFRALLGFLFSFVLYFIYRLLKKKSLSFFPTVVIVLISSYSMAFLWAFCSYRFWWMMKGSGPFQLDYIQFMELSLFELSIVYLAWSALYYLIFYWLELQQQREFTLKATALASQAQLKMLRYQLNPHFLFNSLNTIRALVAEDANMARHMITELSDFLRFSLINGKKETVTLGSELDAINNYLEIQKIRYEDKLLIDFEIDQSVIHYEIPCFLVHPLVENAIKYGIKTSPQPLQVKIKTESQNGSLMVRVSNTGRLLKQEINTENPESTGTGLMNIKQRLQHLFADNYQFRLYEEANWVHAEIQINKSVLHE